MEQWQPAPEAEKPHPQRNGRWVRVVAQIRNNATGEVRESSMPDILDNGEDAPHSFNWSDGNYSCDCNRELFWSRAAGVEVEESECSEGRFSVRVINPATGKAFYDELGE